MTYKESTLQSTFNTIRKWLKEQRIASIVVRNLRDQRTKRIKWVDFVLVDVRSIPNINVIEKGNSNAAEGGERQTQKSISNVSLTGTVTTRKRVQLYTRTGSLKGIMELPWSSMSNAVQNWITDAKFAQDKWRNGSCSSTTITRQIRGVDFYANIVIGYLVILLTPQNFFAKPLIT